MKIRGSEKPCLYEGKPICAVYPRYFQIAREVKLLHGNNLPSLCFKTPRKKEFLQNTTMKINRTTVKTPDPLSFELLDMNPDEMRAMFMDVSVKSLGSWLAYYEGKEQTAICDLIKSVQHYKNGQTSNVVLTD